MEGTSVHITDIGRVVLDQEHRAICAASGCVSKTQAVTAQPSQLGTKHGVSDGGVDSCDEERQTKTRASHIISRILDGLVRTFGRALIRKALEAGGRRGGT